MRRISECATGSVVDQMEETHLLNRSSYSDDLWSIFFILRPFGSTRCLLVRSELPINVIQVKCLTVLIILVVLHPTNPSMPSSSLTIAPLKITQVYAKFRTSDFESWYQPKFAGPSYIGNLIFDGGINIVQRRTDGTALHTVKINPSKFKITKDGPSIFIDIHNPTITAFNNISSTSLACVDVQPPGIKSLRYSVPGPPTSLTSIWLLLDESDPAVHDELDSEFLLSQMGYLVHNQAGPVDRAGWACFVGQIETLILKPCLRVGDGSSTTRGETERCNALKRKFEISQRKVAYVERLFRDVENFHAKEKNLKKRQFKSATVEKAVLSYCDEVFAEQKQLHHARAGKLQREQEEIQREMNELDVVKTPTSKT